MQPDTVEGGAPEHRRGVPAVAHHAAWVVAGLLVVAAVVVDRTGRSDRPGSSASRPASSADAPAADASAAAQADVQLRLSYEAQRMAAIRDVPERYRDAAGRASAMRGGRTPGNFFLALAYVRTRYGADLVRPSALRLVDLGPVQWSRAEFRRWAAPGYGDVSRPLDSFLAVDSALHAGPRPDFEGGAFGPALALGLDPTTAREVAEAYEALDGSGVREALPN